MAPPNGPFLEPIDNGNAKAVKNSLPPRAPNRAKPSHKLDKINPPSILRPRKLEKLNKTVPSFLQYEDSITIAGIPELRPQSSDISFLRNTLKLQTPREGFVETVDLHFPRIRNINSHLSPFTEKRNANVTSSWLKLEALDELEGAGRNSSQRHFLRGGAGGGGPVGHRRVDANAFNDEATQLLSLLDPKNSELFARDDKKDHHGGTGGALGGTGGKSGGGSGHPGLARAPSFRTRGATEQGSLNNFSPMSGDGVDSGDGSGSQFLGSPTRVRSHYWKNHIWNKINLYRNDPKLAAEFSRMVTKFAAQRGRTGGKDFIQRNRNVTANVEAYKARWS